MVLLVNRPCEAFVFAKRCSIARSCRDREYLPWHGGSNSHGVGGDDQTEAKHTLSLKRAKVPLGSILAQCKNETTVRQ